MKSAFLSFCVLLAAHSLATAQIGRLPLPVPFLPIRGATTVPGHGAGINMDLGSGLLGPELSRGNLIGIAVGMGWNDWFTLSLGNPHASDQTFGRARAYLQQLRLKVPFVRPNGGRLAMAVSVSRSWGDLRLSRRATASGVDLEVFQDDHVGSWDFAVPAEVLVGQHRKLGRTSVFIGPRVVLSSYDDRLQPTGPFGAVLPGAVAGVHLSTFMFEFFAETNLVYVPQHGYESGSYAGRVALMPSLGGTLRLGRPFRWGKKPTSDPRALPGYGGESGSPSSPPPRR